MKIHTSTVYSQKDDVVISKTEAQFEHPQRTETSSKIKTMKLYKASIYAKSFAECMVVCAAGMTGGVAAVKYGMKAVEAIKAGKKLATVGNVARAGLSASIIPAAMGMIMETQHKHGEELFQAQIELERLKRELEKQERYKLAADMVNALDENPNIMADLKGMVKQ